MSSSFSHAPLAFPIDALGASCVTVPDSAALKKVRTMTAPSAVVVRGMDSSSRSHKRCPCFPSARIAPPLAATTAVAAAGRQTHRKRHLLRRDSSPDPSSLGLGPSPGRVALRGNSTCNGRSGAYVPRRSSPEDGGGSGADLFEIREHTFVKTAFSKPVNYRLCMEPTKRDVVLYPHCSLISHSKCASRAALTCDLRSKLLMHTAAAPLSFSLARRTTIVLDCEHTNSPRLFRRRRRHIRIHQWRIKSCLSLFKRFRASLTPDPTNPYSSVFAPPSSTTKVTSVVPEGNIIHRK